MTQSALRNDAVVVDGDRLWDSLMELARIGAYDDELTGLRGVCRLTLTNEDAEGRRHVIAMMEARGLEVRVDQIGNVFGRRAGRSDTLPPIMMGSHIDTVATAGAFDGTLGVLGALEVISTFNDLGIETERPIDVACFTEEEGVRFGTDMLGSAVAAGRIRLEDALSLQDKDGRSLGGELARHGFDGAVPVRQAVPAAYLECHIEQGPVLASQGMDIGVVTGVQGISWQEITIVGRAAHAGTTPTELRRDAGAAAALMAVRLRELVLAGEFGQLRATIGCMEFMPNLVNIVPAKATFTVDLRNPDEYELSRAEAAVEALQLEVAREFGVSCSSRRMARTAPVTFDPVIQETIAEEAARRGLSSMALMSGAGHDAQELAAICPTAMIFIPGLHDGISHNPREYSTREACANGINLLAGTVLALANKT